MPAISAVVLTYNEEANIARCLTSLRNVADEIVVVDSFSTDKTAEICSGFNVKFVTNKFLGHIQQKNWGITQSKYPHVLSLDADEALTPELEKSILEAKNDWQADGYEMNRLTSYCGQWIRHCGWYPDRKLRLWDSRLGEWTGENPHDCFVMRPGSKIKRLKGDLFHYSFYSVEDHIRNIGNFSGITARARFDKGIKPSYIKMLFAPPLKFIKTYFFLCGFLDGLNGFSICMNSAHANFLKELKLFELWRQKR